MKKSIMKLLATILMLSAIGLTGCGHKIEPYTESNNQMQYIKKGTPSPFDGWLLTDAELEWLIKKALESQDSPGTLI